MEREIVFKCPRTGMNVQHRLDDDRPDAPGNAYVSVPCPACMALHFVNCTTGKLLGERSGSQPDLGQRSA
ncbi:hypothetical protein LRP30_40755 [Bradyrhizobium sp. C-145]|uniref:hypothetical protein n=1 Tax=Bradyrhizobium sp. C-145 TaxID=574727 RepID=UPI00201B8C62|nr:hypothetical protein [Bradyrhizobium sp. C-145]UQR63000.1 hypothetical protein LRP30_40755 [Bradyrhizobium sp. C-145]